MQKKTPSYLLYIHVLSLPIPRSVGRESEDGACRLLRPPRPRVVGQRPHEVFDPSDGSLAAGGVGPQALCRPRSDEGGDEDEGHRGIPHPVEILQRPEILNYELRLFDPKEDPEMGYV